MADCNKGRLLGYLLNALEDSERQLVEDQLAADEALQEELNQLRDRLQPLAEASAERPPPRGLAERTCRMIASQVAARSAGAAEAVPPRRSQSRPRPKSRALPAVAAWEPAGGSGAWNAFDGAVLAGILLAAALLFFPALVNNRFYTRIANCQNNLQQVGVGLAQYAQFHNDQLPHVPATGNLAFAGVYAPLLEAGGLLDDPGRVLCPGSPRTDVGFSKVGSFPTVARIMAAESGEALDRLQTVAGGDYAYGLGFRENGRYHGRRLQGRPFFALLSDAPRVGPDQQSLNHGGKGQNVLFDDLHVQFLTFPRRPAQTDLIFLNDAGAIAPGIHQDDSVLAASGWKPARLGGGGGSP